MTIAHAIETTMARAESASDRAYHLRKEEEADALDKRDGTPPAAGNGVYWKAAYNKLERLDAANRAKIIEMGETIYALRRKIVAMEDALAECREYFDGRADADQEPGDDYPRPNKEMKLLALIDEATGRQP